VPAAVKGRLGELWAQTGNATAFTTEACTLVSGTTYKITNAAKRQWDRATTVSVFDGGASVAAADYTVQYPLGRIVFASAPAGAVTVSGKYYASAEVGLVQGWDISLTPLIFETTSLGSTSRSYVGGGLLEWSGSFDRFYEDSTWEARAIDNTSAFYLKLYEDEPSDRVWIGYVHFTGWTATTSIVELIKEGITFSGAEDPFYVADET
jgi:hypothetical protein